MNTSRLKAISAVAVLCLLHAIGIAPASAQGNDAMMESLLRPSGWRAEWQGPDGSGVTELIFRRQGEKVTAKIHLILPIDRTCENPVTVGTGTVTFDGCRDPGVTLLFDSSDRDIPFRGKSPRGYEWKLKAK